jgi:hypothetical protein
MIQKIKKLKKYYKIYYFGNYVRKIFSKTLIDLEIMRLV